MNITLTLPLDQVNQLLTILSESPMPFKVSNPLIAAISQQAQAQVDALNKPTPEAAS